MRRRSPRRRGASPGKTPRARPDAQRPPRRARTRRRTQQPGAPERPRQSRTRPGSGPLAHRKKGRYHTCSRNRNGEEHGASARVFARHRVIRSEKRGIAIIARHNNAHLSVFGYRQRGRRHTRPTFFTPLCQQTNHRSRPPYRFSPIARCRYLAQRTQRGKSRTTIR